MSSHAIHSARCWINGQLRDATILIAEGLIRDIKEGRSDNAVSTGEDEILMPGIIDAHVHVNEPGKTDWEGFETATLAAAAGGITTIVDMPLNSSPVTTTLKAFNEKLKASENKLNVNCGFYGGVIPGNENELLRLANAGVQGFKAFLTHSGIDEFPNVEEADLRKAMQLLKETGLPLLAHCEITDADHATLLKQNPRSYHAFLESRPKEWENKAVELMIRLCEEYDMHVHIVHVSSSDALSMIANAKQKGLKLTAETCPHYIYFNAEEIPDGNTLFKCAPPIRELANNYALKNALKTGTLNLIGSDHSPAPASLKEIESGNLLKAWGGIAGLQFLLPASWTALKDSMKPDEFIPLVTENPAAMLGLKKKGKIKTGYDADLVVWSPGKTKTIEASDIFFKHKISPYVSRPLKGVVSKTYVNGEVVYEDGKIIQKNRGEWLLKK